MSGRFRHEKPSARSDSIHSRWVSETTKPKTSKRNRSPRFHPEPRPDCSLCALPHTDPLLTAIWEAYQEKPAPRKVAIQELLDRAKVSTSVAEVERHVSTHRAVQPFPSWGEFRASIERTAHQMNDRHWAILRFVGQAGIVSTEQIREVFFSHLSPSPGAEISKTERAVLRWLMYRHLLYRVWVLGQKRRAPREVYALGRLGAEMLSGAHPLSPAGAKEKAWDYAHEPKSISPQMVPHDLGVTDLFLSLRRSSGDYELGATRFQASMKLDNYWAAEHLGISVKFPAYRDDQVRKFSAARRRIIRPDAFCVIGIELEQALASGNSFGLPLILEHDTGIRRNREVAEQLTSYIHVGTDGALLRRFPELKAPNFKVPVLFSTRGYAGGSGRGRLQNLRQETLGLIRSRHFSERAPIVLAVEEDLRRDGLMAETRDLYTDEPKPLIEVLIATSKPLMRGAGITAETTLQIDRTGAAEKAREIDKDQVSKSEAERLSAAGADLARQERALQEAYERHYEAEEHQPALPQGGSNDA